LGNEVPSDACPVCGASRLQEIRCKVICLNCRTILQSCADLSH
jgi:hypothetical protein